MKSVDYDGKAIEYAEHRQANADVLRRLLSEPRVDTHSKVLEIGCGTGNYILSIQRSVDPSCYAVDRSRDMLAIAAKRTSVIQFVQATAESLPLMNDAFDFVYFVDVLHHVADVQGAIGEAFRVLRTRGRVCTTTDDEETIRQRLHSHYFPEGMQIELNRYPALDDVKAGLESVGFSKVTSERVATPYHVTSSKPYRDKAFSELHLIADEAHERGVKRLERDLQRGPIPAVDRRVLVWASK